MSLFSSSFLFGQMSRHVVLHRKGIDGLWNENNLIFEQIFFLWVSTFVTITDCDWLRQMVIGWLEGSRGSFSEQLERVIILAFESCQESLAINTNASYRYHGLAKSDLIWKTLFLHWDMSDSQLKRRSTEDTLIKDNYDKAEETW